MSRTRSPARPATQQARPSAWFNALAAAACLALSGCATVEFYAQAVGGQLSLMLARQDAAAVIADPATPPAVATRLQHVGKLLRYAETELGLPANGSYRSYVEVEGYPVWYVVAAEEFDTRALPRCYPIIGCAIYRGYFSERGAKREAARLAAAYDVHVGGAAAYSTLGWFEDPVFSTFLHYDDAALADLLFHELAHQVAYVRDDTTFNESYANFVGQAGALQWLADHGGDAPGYRTRLAGAAAYAQFLRAWRDRLAVLYQQPLAPTTKRQRKAEEFVAMQRCYQAHRETLGDGRYDAAMAQPYNNARLALAGAYANWRGAFATLFEQQDGNWPAFHSAVRQLAAEPPAQRTERLLALQANAVPDGTTRPLPACAQPPAEATA